MSHHQPCADPSYVGIGLDWLTAIVVAEADWLIGELAQATGLEPRTCRPLKGYGYQQAVGLYGGDTPTMTVMAGPNRNPCIVAIGEHSDRAHRLLANRFPHRCTASRKDACVDLGDADWFDVLTANAVQIANRRALRLDNRGDWFAPGSPAGRTLYVGSRDSECYLRIYEYRKHHKHGPNVRLELEYKPQSPEGKGWLFGASPAEILGRSPLVVELLERIGVDVSRTIPRLASKAPTSLERAMSALLHQYGALLRDRVLPTLNNDAAALGPYLLQALAAQEDDRQKISAAAKNRVPLPPLEGLPVGY